MKHAGALLKLMNKLQDMVHCSEDLREVPDILYCKKVEKPAGGFPVEDASTPVKPPAPKKPKKSIKKNIKLNTDCNNDVPPIM